MTDQTTPAAPHPDHATAALTMARTLTPIDLDIKIAVESVEQIGDEIVISCGELLPLSRLKIADVNAEGQGLIKAYLAKQMATAIGDALLDGRRPTQPGAQDERVAELGRELARANATLEFMQAGNRQIVEKLEAAGLVIQVEEGATPDEQFLVMFPDLDCGGGGRDPLSAICAMTAGMAEELRGHSSTIAALRKALADAGIKDPTDADPTAAVVEETKQGSPPVVGIPVDKDTTVLAVSTNAPPAPKADEPK